MAVVVETNDIRAEAEVKAEISELAAFFFSVKGLVEGVGQGAWYGSS